MKKTWKKVVASVLAVALSAGTFATVNHKTVSAEDNQTATTETVKVTGASIRFISENTAVDGIRFAVTVANEDFESVKAQGWKLLVMPTALIDGELDKDESYAYGDNQTAKPVSVDIEWSNAKVEGGNRVVRIYLNEIDANYYTTDITARAYCEDNGTVTYSNELKRSYYEVAEKALDDVKDKTETGYTNQAGSKFSPYDATQRDALLGVKYEKTGTWDLQDGNLVQQSSAATDGLSDRDFRTSRDEYVISTSFKTRSIEEVGSSLFGGFQFGYDAATNSFLELNYYQPTSMTGQLVPAIRGYNGVEKNWLVFIGRDGNATLEPDTWYDFHIIINETETQMTVNVMYRKSGTGNEFAYATKQNQTVSYKDLPYGSETRMYAGRNYSGHTYSASIGYNDDYVVLQDRGKTITSTDNSLKVSGTGVTGRVQIVDLNNKVTDNGNNNANFVLSVDMVWEDKNTSAWQDTGFQIGGYNMTATGLKAEMYFSPRGLRIYNNGWKVITLEQLKDSVNGLDKVIAKIAAGTPVTWTIEAKTSGSTTTVKYYVDGLLCVTEECSNTSMFSNYIMYVANSNVTFSNLKFPEEVPVTKYEIANQKNCTATLKQNTTGVTITQTGGGEVDVLDKVNVLPNKDNFTVEVDMSSVSQATGLTLAQGIKVGGRQVVINSNRVALYDGGWASYLFSANSNLSDMSTKLTTNNFTFIVTVSGNTMTIGVRVADVETILAQHVLKTALNDTTLKFYSSSDKIATDATIERTFGNVKFVAVTGYDKVSNTRGDVLKINDNGFSITSANAWNYDNIKAKYYCLPNVDDVTVSVDMSAVVQNGAVVAQAVKLCPGVEVRLANTFLQIIGVKDANGWTTYQGDDITVPNGFGNQAYTYILHVYKSEGVQLLDVKVSVDGVETVVKSGIQMNDMSCANLEFYAVPRTGKNGDNILDKNITTTFSDIKIINNVKAQ